MSINKLYQLYKDSSGVSTDTRNIKQGNLFFALKGGNFNGNKYAAQAIENGANYAIIDEEKYSIGGKTFLVNNVLESLQQLATFHREKLSLPIIGLTGSNGKTTSKELIYSVLKERYNCYCTQGNFNNHIGVPLTLLSLSEEHEIGIVEMGANHQKEISLLSSIAKPDYGLITNIGKAHLEGFGGIDGVKKGKRELFDFMEQSEGIVFYNAADPVIREKLPSVELVPYNTKDSVLVTKISDNQLLEVDLCIGSESIRINSHLIGDYNTINLSLAAAIGDYFGLSLEEIKRGVESYIPSNNRSQLEVTDKNKLILDAYNANPTSTELALRNFSQSSETNKLVILGDMLELGEYSEEEHRKIAELTESLGLETYFVGPEFNRISKSYGEFFNDTESLLKHLSETKLKCKTILIKGSRGMKLESCREHL